MSIRTKILLPLLMAVAVVVFTAGFVSWKSRQDQVIVAAITDKVTGAGELSRKASEEFVRLRELVTEVTAMTHFVDAATIGKRFGDDAALMEADLTALREASLSDEMTKATNAAAERFANWRGEAEGVLGLKPVGNIATMDVLKRDGVAFEGLLNVALGLVGHDARQRVAEVAATARMGTNALMAFAILFGIAGVAGAFWLARNLTQPLKALVDGAQRLAGGDVEVSFGSLDRTDEVGEIARAVAAFRDNVIAAQAANRAATDERQAAEAERRRNEGQRLASVEEQSRVVDALSQGLERLAAGDLTYRIAFEFGPAYQRLKTNFNHSLDVLQQAMRAIAEGAHELQSGSSEIAGLAADLSTRTGSQTAGIEEAAAALEEITSTVKMTAENAGQARGLVSKTRGEAEKSGEVVRTAVEAIGRIRQSSQEIEKIISVIDEIAFQTNLLALNAGVEAARAGESGRGFAVVATEVRALAQRSADASKEIKTLISGSSAQVKEGVDLVNSAGAALDRIFAQVSEIDSVVTNIANGAAEQSSGLQSVNNGVSQIDRANQGNVGIVEQTTSACASVADRAEQLVDAVARFRVEEREALRRAA